MKILGLRILLAVALTACVATVALAADTRLGQGDLEARARQPSPTTLEVDFWFRGTARVKTATATLAGHALPAPKIAPYPQKKQVTAVMFLVDTSDPRRKAVIAQTVKDISAILDKAAPHHKFALARFDTKLIVLAPFGGEPDALRTAVNSLRAVGQRTELFRLSAAAVRILAATKADRKVLILMSDGQAEDDARAYPLAHARDAARRAEVRIFALGYSKKSAPPISFQNLRRLSNETGGRFSAADSRLKLPRSFLDDPFAEMDNGGRLGFDFTAAIAAGVGGAQTVILKLVLEDGATLTLPIPVSLPPPPLVERIQQRENLPWAAAGGVAALVLLVGGLWLLLRAMRRRRAVRAALTPIAYLEFLDDDGSRFPMRGTALRIGRNADNDVHLVNNSISGYHGEIHRKRDGTFIITDLDSLNKIHLNGEPVSMARIEDGDEIDFGEVRFRFTISPEA